MPVFKAQYDKLRAEKTAGVKNPLLLVKLGNFYEAFYDDAGIIGEILRMPVDNRGEAKHIGIEVSYAVEYIKKLEAAGYSPIIAKEDKDAE